MHCNFSDITDLHLINRNHTYLLFWGNIWCHICRSMKISLSPCSQYRKQVHLRIGSDFRALIQLQCLWKILHVGLSKMVDKCNFILLFNSSVSQCSPPLLRDETAKVDSSLNVILTFHSVLTTMQEREGLSRWCQEPQDWYQPAPQWWLLVDAEKWDSRWYSSIEWEDWTAEGSTSTIMNKDAGQTWQWRKRKRERETLTTSQ